MAYLRLRDWRTSFQDADATIRRAENNRSNGEVHAFARLGQAAEAAAALCKEIIDDERKNAFEEWCTVLNRDLQIEMAHPDTMPHAIASMLKDEASMVDIALAILQHGFFSDPIRHSTQASIHATLVVGTHRTMQQPAWEPKR